MNVTTMSIDIRLVWFFAIFFRRPSRLLENLNGLMLLKNAQYVVGLMMRFKKNIRTGVVARMTCPSTKPARHTKKDALLNSHGAISTAFHSLIPGICS